MKRRSFLTGLFAAPIVAALPASKAVAAVASTVMGRWTSSAPATRELSRSQVKSIMFARSYGMGLKAGDNITIAGQEGAYRVANLIESDLSRIEARVARNIEYGQDPYTLGALQ